MERTLELNINIQKNGQFTIESYEPESGFNMEVYSGNINDVDTDKFRDCLGDEVYSWIATWAESAAEEDEEEE